MRIPIEIGKLIRHPELGRGVGFRPDLLGGGRCPAFSAARGRPGKTDQLVARKPIVTGQFTAIRHLKHQHPLSICEVARRRGIAPSTVGDYLQGAESAEVV